MRNYEVFRSRHLFTISLKTLYLFKMVESVISLYLKKNSCLTILNRWIVFKVKWWINNVVHHKNIIISPYSSRFNLGLQNWLTFSSIWIFQTFSSIWIFQTYTPNLPWPHTYYQPCLWILFSVCLDALILLFNTFKLRD